jgi:hypothetical protein
LRLKSFNNTGYIKHFNGYLSILSTQLGESRQTVKTRLKSLINSSWIDVIKKDEKIVGYKLISYSDLWKSLGYEFKKTGKGLKGCYTIYSIDLSLAKSKKDLQLLISGYDLIRTSQRMTREYFKKKSVNSKKTCQDNYSVFLPLSSQGVANVLGFKSTRKGFDVLKQVEALNLISVKRDSELVGRFHASEYKKLRTNTSMFKDSARFKHDKGGYGFVYQKKCNEIMVYNTKSLLKFNLQITSQSAVSKREKTLLGF